MKRKLVPDRQCPVCSKRVNGSHYGVLTCGGCYTFFKRATKENVYHKCKDRQSFNWVTGRCRGCRWEKCIKVGMAKKGTRSAAGKGTAKLDYQSKTIVAGSKNQRASLEKHIIRTPAVDQLKPKWELDIEKSLQLDYSKKMLSDEIKTKPRSPFSEHNSLRSSCCDSESSGSLLNDTGLIRWAISSANQAAMMAFKHSNWTSYLEQTVQSTDVNPTAIPVSPRYCDPISELKVFVLLLSEQCQIHPASHSQHDAFWELNRIDVAQWKLFVAFLIFSAPTKSYRTLDEPSKVNKDCDRFSPQQQPLLSQTDCADFTEHLCELIGDLELDHTCRYLLMAVIFCEPNFADLSTTRLAVLHGYYLNALLAVVGKRCPDSSHFECITQRLDRFFGALPMVHELVEHIPYMLKLIK